MGLRWRCALEALHGETRRRDEGLSVGEEELRLAARTAGEELWRHHLARELEGLAHLYHLLLHHLHLSTVSSGGERASQRQKAHRLLMIEAAIRERRVDGPSHPRPLQETPTRPASVRPSRPSAAPALISTVPVRRAIPELVPLVMHLSRSSRQRVQLGVVHPRSPMRWRIPFPISSAVPRHLVGRSLQAAHGSVEDATPKATATASALVSATFTGVRDGRDPRRPFSRCVVVVTPRTCAGRAAATVLSGDFVKEPGREGDVVEVLSDEFSQFCESEAPVLMRCSSL